VVADVPDYRVQGGFEGVGGVLGLSEDESALHRGQQCEGKLARVGIARQGATRTPDRNRDPDSTRDRVHHSLILGEAGSIRFLRCVQYLAGPEVQVAAVEPVVDPAAVRLVRDGRALA